MRKAALDRGDDSLTTSRTLARGRCELAFGPLRWLLGLERPRVVLLAVIRPSLFRQACALERAERCTTGRRRRVPLPSASAKCSSPRQAMAQSWTTDDVAQWLSGWEYPDLAEGMQGALPLINAGRGR